MRGMTLEDATAYFANSHKTLEDAHCSYSPDALRNPAEIMDVKPWSIARGAESRKERTYRAEMAQKTKDTA